ncbi:flavodoxin [Pueribacillus sp. YX66]|uniref:flavodoxin n=1 Tax=Pueribacillus sp. YX66 TaxID=3229242 RepID=UPI00358D14C6
MRALVSYLSYSGNTEEVAELIGKRLLEEDFHVDWCDIGIERPHNLSVYNYIFIGTFTWAKGQTPDEVKDFVYEIGYKPENVAVFGTGDTQFGGDDMFCLAVDKLATFYESKWPGLKIEQSPRGSQEAKVGQWVEGVLYDAKSFA